MGNSSAFRTRLFVIARKALPRNVRLAAIRAAFRLDEGQFGELAFQRLAMPHMQQSLVHARNLGLRPRKILDIGAFEGEWTRMALAVWDDASVVMLEANPLKISKLQGVAATLGATAVHALLGRRSGEQVGFHLLENGSSVYKENSGHPTEYVTQPTRALDDVVEASGADFIKIDTQGYELEVLKGGLRTLSKAQAVLLEVSLIAVNSGAPLLHEVVAFMAENGFVAYDILEVHRRPLDRALHQIDVLFIPENSVLRRDTRHW